jgi:arylsulfatase A-like enzyme
MYPFECGLIKNEKSTLKKIGLAFGGTFIADETQTISGYLQEAGYKTIAVHGGGYVSEFYGFDKGFSLYDKMSGRAEDAIELALKYLENNKKHKFFLFFHTYEIHDPYKHDYFVSQLPLSERTYRNNTIARYDSGIRYTDTQIGKLISWLKKCGLFEKTLVIITSDHGENFDRLRTKEGAGSHGNTLYDSEIHVPLILGGAVPFDQRLAITDQVSSSDILPTIMDFLNIPISKKVRGISLMPLIDGEKMTQRMAYSEAIHALEEKKSVRTLENKLIADLKRESKNTSDEINYELYDLVRDERESENIFTLKPTVAKTFIQYLKQIIKSVDANRRQLAKTRYQLPQHDKELMNDLKGLGYIGN